MTVQPYDFRKPGRIHTALEQQFQVWLEAACAIATRRGQKDLPESLEISLAGSEAQLAHPALLALPDDMIGYRVTLQDKLVTLLAWPRRLILGIVSILMGDAVTELPPSRDLTAVDQSLFEFYLRDMLFPAFVQNWAGAKPMQVEIGETIPHPRWAKLFPLDCALLVIRFQVKGAFGEESWSLLFPRSDLLAAWGSNSEDTEQRSDAAEHLAVHVQELPVELTVELGRADLALTQLAQLRPGDLVLLNQAVNEPLLVRVEGSKKLRAWPGCLGSRQALRIEDWHK